MLKSLHLRDFKSFRDTNLPLAPFTLLIGANASGKSNVREALRFLHGVSRGYTFAEILGEKWIEGGVRVWTGVRGGALQVVRAGGDSFGIGVAFEVHDGSRRHRFDYALGIGLNEDGTAVVESESLHDGANYVFDTHPDGIARGASGPMSLKARVRKYGGGHPPDGTFLQDRPIIGQLLDNEVATDATRRVARSALKFLESMTFLDLDPDSARRSSPRGISVLGDRGENLSSVLAVICSDSTAREVLTAWIRALTPMDAVDIAFEEDLNNRVLAVLIEEGDLRTPLTSASDGTVRFLAMIAALLNPSRPSMIFIEEVENGIHPNRVSLLLELIQQSVESERCQVVSTSHSPQLLMHTLGSTTSRPVLLFRDDRGHSTAVDIKERTDFMDTMTAQDGAALMAAGWLEDVAAFAQGDESRSLTDTSA